MFSRYGLAAFLLAATASAQTFMDVVEKTPDLSLFGSLLKLNTSFALPFLKPPSDSSRTILIPNNAAILKFMQNNGVTSPADIPMDKVLPFLSYHVLLNNISSSDFNIPGGSVVETTLTDKRYALLKGNSGQVIYGMPGPAQSKGPAIESGLKETINIVEPDIVYNNGLIHIVDGLLTLPTNCSKTIGSLGAQKLVEIIGRVGLLDDLDTTAGATCFAPSDAAIEQALPILQNLTDKEIIDAIKFHLLLDPYYTNNLTDGQKIPTLLGPSITVNVKAGEYFFNGVKAKSVNDIAKNGVAYVLDGIMPVKFAGMTPNNNTTTTAKSITMLPTATPTDTTTQGPSITSSLPPSVTSGAGSGAGMVKVGGSIFLSGLMGLLAFF